MSLPPPTLEEYAAINDLSVLELLNEDNDHRLTDPLRMWGGGSVLKGVIRFQRKRHSHYKLVITEDNPSLPLGNFHILNGPGSPWYLDSSKISLPAGHQWRDGCFLQVLPPPYEASQTNPQGVITWDLRDREWTYLVLDTMGPYSGLFANMRMWIDAREP